MDDTAAAQQSVPKQIVYENTYITGPEGYGQASLLDNQNNIHLTCISWHDCSRKRDIAVRTSKVTVYDALADFSI
jgi:hypothetical protein